MSQKFGQFWLRKLHSISGLLFIGLFLLFHFVYPGENIFSKGYLIYIVFFSIPLIFHIFYGAYIIYEGNIQFYCFLRNWLYILQRVSGIIIFLFIPVHIYIMETKTGYIYNTGYIIFWIIGTIAAVYHLSNGIYGFLIHWGITIGNKSQKAVIILAVFVFIILFILSLNSLADLIGRLGFIRSIYNFLFA